MDVINKNIGRIKDKQTDIISGNEDLLNQKENKKRINLPVESEEGLKPNIVKQPESLKSEVDDILNDLKDTKGQGIPWSGLK